jgi:hypothetical protein
LPSYKYIVRRGRHQWSAYFETAHEAAIAVVREYHRHTGVPMRVEKDGRLLWDTPLLERLYRVCRPDLERDDEAVPRALARLRAREGGATG